ncbi:FAD-dependent oxidoreductase [Pseudooceanicola sp. 216_PA32_1]|uniref:FAD-dependent oxidoreductase n=1 Tax=Pseudooceanicola pacificus TaxID=2676438 RepID=A0A844WCQ2_9RHOB|nr:FAD-binding oxidoreductase [Pseudooceanicola pacificus]MWB78818.1 FAD-dependent oxidoreductase [Pseudooceanicola pacificus]
MQISEHQPISLWDSSAAEPDPDTTAPRGDREAELAIVGGGFTGLSTALHAAQAGHDCLLLEAERIGHGGSGRNVGLVNAGVWLPPRKAMEVLGPERGRSFVEYLGRAPGYVFDLIEAHQIRCEPRREGTIHAAHAPSGLRDLSRRAAQWEELGAPVELLTGDEMEARTGTARYHGGLLDRRAGTVNPMGYARGLARAAAAAGARIATGVRVTSLRRDGDGWVLGTTRGQVRARHVVLGTNAYSDALWPGLAESYVPIDFFQLSTEPLGARAAQVLPGGQGLWDTGQIMFSLRRDAAGRIAVGSMGRVMGALSHRWAARRLRHLFPDLGPVRFEQAWSGRIAMTDDHIPRIHRLAEGLYTPIGYNGRGITTGTMFGKAMAGLLSGEAEGDLPLPLSDLHRPRARRLRTAFFRAAFAANQLMKSV